MRQVTKIDPKGFDGCSAETDLASNGWECVHQQLLILGQAFEGLVLFQDTWLFDGVSVRLTSAVILAADHDGRSFALHLTVEKSGALEAKVKKDPLYFNAGELVELWTGQVLVVHERKLRLWAAKGMIDAYNDVERRRQEELTQEPESLGSRVARRRTT